MSLVGELELAWQVNGTPDTLTSSGSSMEISDLTALKFNQFLIHGIATGGTAEIDNRFDSDSSTNYADRFSIDGGSDLTGTSVTSLRGTGFNVTAFWMMYAINIAAEEKLVISNIVYINTAGAATAPNRREMVGKWDNVSDAFTTETVVEVGAGSLDTDSNLSALGTD